MWIHFIIFSSLILFLLLWSKNFLGNFKKSESPYIKLIICIVFTLLFKYDYGFHFLGLEYEDAYSFSAYTRQLSYGVLSDSLRIQCVDIGSLSNPQSLGTYGGHYITYPIFLYLFTSIFGFSITGISIINSFISLLSILTLAFFKYENRYGWIVAVSIFCLAPAINLFSTCFLSESFSAFLCLCFVLGFFNLKNNNSEIYKIFVYLSFFLCILTKRDNAILILVPFTYAIFELFHKEYKQSIRYVLPYLIIIVLSSIFIHNLFLAEFEESTDISQTTFSFSIFLSQFPIYIKSLLSFPFFSVSAIFFSILLIYNIVSRKFSPSLVSLSVLFVASIIMYSSHYRGYYFVENLEPFNEFSTFRYLNNFFYIIPCFIALSFSLPRKYEITTLTSVLILNVFTFFLTLTLRANFSQEEYAQRFEDIENVAPLLDANDVLITDVPLLFFNLISPEQNICNIQRISELNFNSSHRFYFYADDLNVLDNRYNLNLSKFDKQVVSVLPSGLKLYLIDKKP